MGIKTNKRLIFSDYRINVIRFIENAIFDSIPSLQFIESNIKSHQANAAIRRSFNLLEIQKAFKLCRRGLIALFNICFDILCCETTEKKTLWTYWWTPKQAEIDWPISVIVLIFRSEKLSSNAIHWTMKCLQKQQHQFDQTKQNAIIAESNEFVWRAWSQHIFVVFKRLLWNAFYLLKLQSFSGNRLQIVQPNY